MSWAAIIASVLRLPGLHARTARVTVLIRLMRLLAVTIVVAGLLGCDSLASSDYVGQPLFTLTGTFVAASSSPQGSVGGLALLWQDPASSAGRTGVSPRPPCRCRSRFHRQFSVIDVHAPPPLTPRGSRSRTPTLAIAGGVRVRRRDPTHPRRSCEPCGASDRGHALVYCERRRRRRHAGRRLPRRRDLRRLLSHLRQLLPRAATPGMAQAQMIRSKLHGERRGRERRVQPDPRRRLPARQADRRCERSASTTSR